MVAATQPVISCVGLTKVFRDFWQRSRVWAVRDLDLEVPPGEIFGLLGPNGSGKSTAIKMILGLLHPSRGRVAVFGQSPDDVRTKQRIGYLPEESYLYRFLNARETLDYYGTLFRLPRRERRRRSEELLEMVGLKSAARRPVGEYSKGMARRIGLAQALINDPDLLILDEPTSGLDPIGSQLVKDIIVRLGKVHRKTILLSSHLLADVEEVCSRVTILFGGRVQTAGTMEEVLARADMTQITAPRLSAETIEAIRAIIQQREGHAAEVATPHDRLNELFLRIVREAHERRIETAGAAVGGEIAEFLGQGEAPEQVIESLVSAPQPAEEAPAEAAAPEGAVDERVIQDLSGEERPAEPPPPPAPGEQPPAERPRAEEVDEDILADLTGKRRKDDEQA